MNRMLVLAVGLFFVAAGLSADEKKSEKEVTVKGEVVDVACYIAHGARGEKHKACAEACADAGGALGVLTSDGKLYVSLLPDEHNAGPNALLKDHIAQTVEAKGFLRSKGGVSGMVVKSVSAAGESSTK